MRIAYYITQIRELNQLSLFMYVMLINFTICLIVMNTSYLYWFPGSSGPLQCTFLSNRGQAESSPILYSNNDGLVVDRFLRVSTMWKHAKNQIRSFFQFPDHKKIALNMANILTKKKIHKKGKKKPKRLLFSSLTNVKALPFLIISM